MKNRQTPIVLILYNIRSLLNVGAIFRTADGVNIEKIFLIGTTPTPPRHEISKTALGAEKKVSWEYSNNIFEIISQYKKLNYTICALEQFSSAKNLLKEPVRAPLVLIVGNEITGIEIDVLKICDTVLEIPMMGSTNSLNVATATGIALYILLSKFCYDE